MYPKKNENVSPHKNLCVNIHTNIIYNSLNVETMWMSINGESDNLMWYTQTIEYQLVIKRNEVLNHTMIWTNLENIMLSGGISSQKVTHKWSYLYEMPRIGKFINTEVRLEVVRGYGRWGSGKGLPLGAGFFFFEGGNAYVVKLTVVMITILCGYSSLSLIHGFTFCSFSYLCQPWSENIE